MRVGVGHVCIAAVFGGNLRERAERKKNQGTYKPVSQETLLLFESDVGQPILAAPDLSRSGTARLESRLQAGLPAPHFHSIMRASIEQSRFLKQFRDRPAQ